MEKAINHFCHEHPLFLTKQFNEETLDSCYVCGDVVANMESAYTCKEPHLVSHSRFIIHKRCGELPRRILSHPSHSQHPLHLFDYRHFPEGYSCDFCRVDMGITLGYRCPSCKLDTHIECIDLGLLKERKELQHPGHIHPLTLMRKHAFSFSCDGCGTKDVDMAYVCSTCEYWVHKTCALLPSLLPQDRHQCHHHPLSLAFCFPMKHRRYIYKCDVCDKDFDMACWLYFCDDCRYFAHLKCVGSTTKQDVLSTDDQSDVIQFPLADISISSMLITPFVMREKGIIPNVNDMPRIIKMGDTTAGYSYYHKHPLSLVSQDDDEGKALVNHEEDDDEDEEMKICEVCVTPISSPPYYQCIDCKYFIHLICCMLPNTLSSPSSSTSQYGECPVSYDKNHKFVLHASDKDTSWHWCYRCGYSTNGMVYSCEKCGMSIDVKCASLPTAIKHASHSHSHPNLIFSTIKKTKKSKWIECYYCAHFIGSSFVYICSEDGCEFASHLTCAQLPLSVRKPEWDHHPLLLTFDASSDHPSDFFCEFCEKEMHPKKPMYHCRQCDQSYHFNCLASGSGDCRNIKFGRQFKMDSIHPHPLTYNYITLKKRCDICHIKVYDNIGFECVSCYFVVCLRCRD